MLLAQERDFFFPLLLLSLSVLYIFFAAVCSSYELGPEMELLELLHVLLNYANCFLFQGLVNVEMERIRTVGISDHSFS